MRESSAASVEEALSAETVNPGWQVVAAAFFGVMVGFSSIMVYTFGIFLKPLSAEFGWSRESISAAFGIAAMTVAVTSPFLGRLLDKHGPRAVVIPCIVTFGLGVASLSLLTPSLFHLYATFLLIGAVGNGTTQMGYSRAVSSWFTDKRGLALAVVMGGVGVGAIVCPALAQSMIATVGWRTAYLVFGCLSLLIGVPLAAVFLREAPVTYAGAATMTGGSSIREGLQSRAFWLLVATLFLSSIAVNGAITHLAPLLTDRGIGAGRASLAVSVLGGTSLIGRLFTGHLLDRFSGARVSFLLLLIVAGGMLLLSSTESAAVALVAAAMIGTGLGGEADVTPYLLTRYFGLRSFSSLYGLTWTFYAIAGGLGPMLMGKAFDVSGSYGPLLLWLSGVTVLSAVLMLLMPSYPEPGRRVNAVG
jgi:MFS family permease